MIRIQGDCLSKKSKQLLKNVTIFTMDYLLKGRRKKKARLIITIDEPDADQIAEDACGQCWCDVNDDKSLTIRIWLDQSSINRSGKTLFLKHKKLLMDLCHELVHAGQYITGDLVELKPDGSVFAYKKKRYVLPDINATADYYLLPHEQEAYGLEQGLFHRLKENSLINTGE